MQPLFDLKAPKKATNLSVNSDLLAKSRALNVNLSATLEKALQAELAAVSAKKWQKDNQASIKAYNNLIEEHGCFSDNFREF